MPPSMDADPMTPHAQAEAVVGECTHSFCPHCHDYAKVLPGACAACLTTALQAQAKRDVALAKARCACGSGYALQETCAWCRLAKAIESAAGLG